MQNSLNLKIQLTLMNALQFAVWGAYLTCMGRYLSNLGFSTEIGWFYSVQGIVSIFMPALMGIVADRWIPAQRLLGLCHLIAGAFMIAAAMYGLSAGPGNVKFGILFLLYTISVAFYMPTLALNNSVSYNALTQANLDPVSAFPPIRVFGTVGFILTMWFVDLTGFQDNQNQFITSGVLSIILFGLSFTLPNCPINKSGDKKSFVEALGLRAFTLFKRKEMAVFFIFSMLLGVSLQITNGFANTFIFSFGAEPQYADTFGVQHSNMLISLSQISETLCILLIPFCMKRFGIKNVMLIAMFSWVGRFAFFGMGNPAMPGVLFFVLSCIVYGFAFDFFNISGSLYVEQNVAVDIRSSAQGLFMMMTNGFGATIGTLAAGAVVDACDVFNTPTNWPMAWYIFAGYACVVGILFAILFKNPQKQGVKA